MTLEEIAFELELAGLRLEEQRMLLSSIKRSGFDAKLLDRKLIGMGYAPIFSIYDDDAIAITKQKV
ncbi:MAG: hypothetical protein KC427_03765 [Sulfurovum sp.]|uniref:hypothetical protein n=1 Tax=Sulfurovum sp. TaxID=1969726 RepID=UPI002868127B|nr:hypothetical protein [Sulfurovum sp.]MCO4845117.1 hypothetical protein [Sulfurovum sp.]